MKTVLEIALSTKFNAEQIPGLMEIINNTPNTELAAEIILGLYKEPTVSEQSVLDGRLCTLMNYNKWNGDVTYSFTTVKKKQVYVKKDVPEESITAENYKEHEVSKDGQWIYVTFPNETENRTAWIQLKSWELGASRVGQMQP